eukprot:493960-Rhodomonas_salina.1
MLGGAAGGHVRVAGRLPLPPLSPPGPPTPRNQTQETAIAVQFVPGTRFLAFEFAVYSTFATPMRYVALYSLCDVRD